MDDVIDGKPCFLFPQKPGIYYYDSMGGDNNRCLESIEKYLQVTQILPLVAIVKIKINFEKLVRRQ